ncbi:MAG: hypothetical protein HKN41_00085 [Ilumatobacter sp.]|nr:hypothetical protein [Ilumatobacter sp.]
MRVEAFVRALIALLVVIVVVSGAAAIGSGGVVRATVDDDPPPTRAPVTVNEFLPEDRSLGDCISAVPKPGCGSEARGGWRQGLVLAAILAGLALIAWRVVAGARRARSGPVDPA